MHHKNLVTGKIASFTEEKGDSEVIKLPRQALAYHKFGNLRHALFLFLVSAVGTSLAEPDDHGAFQGVVGRLFANGFLSRRLPFWTLFRPLSHYFLSDGCHPNLANGFGFLLNEIVQKSILSPHDPPRPDWRNLPEF